MPSAKEQSPSQSQHNILLEHYQSGHYNDAEKLAISLTEQFPYDQFSWKVLGAALKKIGRISESLVASQKAVEINPQDIEAHNNLGNTLQELGKLEEAEASYRQAIVLKPDFAVAHNNLGNTLKGLGKLEEAGEAYSKAIILKTDYDEAHNNLGVTLQKLGKLEEAEASYRQAIVLKPDFAVAHNNLGNTLKELGKLEEAEASYRQAIELEPNYAEAYYNLGALYLSMGRNFKERGKISEAVKCFEQALKIYPEDSIGATLELARLGHKSMPDKTPLSYMQNFYKTKAKAYELGIDNKYFGHLLIENAFKQTHTQQGKVDILDLGCGAGNLGRFLRPYARTLDGVDLSPDMLQVAEKTEQYNSLHKKDLAKYLDETSIHYDMVIAAAVMVHFSNLEEVFSLVNDTLKVNGKFIFSIFEGTEKDIELNSSLFYVHSDNYVRTLANDLNFKIIYRHQGIHEYHKEIPISTLIYSLQKGT